MRRTGGRENEEEVKKRGVHSLTSLRCFVKEDLGSSGLRGEKNPKQEVRGEYLRLSYTLTL